MRKKGDTVNTIVDLRCSRSPKEQLGEPLRKLKELLVTFFGQRGLTGKWVVHFMGEVCDDQIPSGTVVPVQETDLLILLHARPDNGHVFRCGLVATWPKAVFGQLGGAAHREARKETNKARIAAAVLGREALKKKNKERWEARKKAVHVEAMNKLDSGGCVGREDLLAILKKVFPELSRHRQQEILYQLCRERLFAVTQRFISKDRQTKYRPCPIFY